MVERAHERTMAGLGRRVAGLDLGCLRLHDIPADHAADLAGIRRPADRGDRRIHLDLVDALIGCNRLGLAGRSGRAQDAADDLDRMVFRLQLHRRLFPDILVSVPVPRAPGHRHGGGMAGRRSLGDGAMADPIARFYGRDAASILGPWRGAVERRLRPSIRLDRLARPAYDW